MSRGNPRLYGIGNMGYDRIQIWLVCLVGAGLQPPLRAARSESATKKVGRLSPLPLPAPDFRTVTLITSSPPALPIARICLRLLDSSLDLRRWRAANPTRTRRAVVEPASRTAAEVAVDAAAEGDVVEDKEVGAAEASIPIRTLWTSPRSGKVRRVGIPLRFND
jgi:hypothetical protein